MPSLLKSLSYDSQFKTLGVLDQLKVPQELTYIKVPDSDAAWKVIRNMNVRGAPLIAITGMLGLAAEVSQKDLATNTSEGSGEQAVEFLVSKMAHLRTSRPTAVNLCNAIDEMTGLAKETAATVGSTAKAVVEAFVKAAEKMLEDDVADNKAIGEHGADAVLAKANGRAKVRVLTVCNTGSLACAGWGTALGVVRSLHARGALEEVVALETRPYNQGSRLTAFEIVQEQMPGRLITDNMAAAFMRLHQCDAILVGADRVCCNGDTANKIGTYMLAVLAKHHGVPLYVCAPFTTLDLNLATGEGIVVEQRAPEELLKSAVAPDGIPVWNPAFDVTPGALIAGIVTEHGVIAPGADGFDCRAFVEAHRDSRAVKRRKAE